MDLHPRFDCPDLAKIKRRQWAGKDSAYMVRPILFFSILGALLSACSALADKVDDYIRFRMEKEHIPGLSLAVVREGKVIKAKGYGVASLELNAPANPNTVYQIGSLTKQF